MNTNDVYLALRQELLSVSAITDIVDQRVFFAVVPRDEEVPAIALTPSGGARTPYFIGAFDFAEMPIQVSIFSKSAADILAVYDYCNTTYGGFNGTIGDESIYIQRTSVDDLIVLGEESGIHSGVFDINFYYTGA